MGVGIMQNITAGRTDGFPPNPIGVHVLVLIRTTALLVISNVFMTFAWYAHLKELSMFRGLSVVA